MMRQRAAIVLLAGVGLGGSRVADRAEVPVQVLETVTIPVPRDHFFSGTIALNVVEADVAHKLFVVREHIPVQSSGPMTLVYPRWEAASHGPSISVSDLAGLRVFADGRRLPWRRDPVESHAFHIAPPAGTRAVDIEFQVVGQDDRLSPDVMVLHWQHLLLYPAGWFARNIPVRASVVLPPELQVLTSLERNTGNGQTTAFTPVSLEMLLDAPVYAVRYVRGVLLSEPGDPPLWFNVIAKRPEDAIIPPEQLNAFRRLARQTRLVFGAAPYRRFDILARMSDGGSAGGTEHRRSCEIAIPSDYFRNWAGQLNNRDIVAHEIVHAWNGLYRVPADLWAPTPNVPQGGSLLWMYEGQTEFWGRVLAARAGLRDIPSTRDRLALDAAEVANRPGRSWRPLSDDVNYPSFMLRQPVPWRDWQRRRDYYDEGVMLWLDVDARLRERSAGRVGIDDFARRFFAGASDAGPARTYTFRSLCAALAAVASSNWADDLRRWVDGLDTLDTTAGLTRDGWRVFYTPEPTAAFRQNETESGETDLSYSIGLTVKDTGVVGAVTWGGPAFRAGLAPRARIIAVAGTPFSRAGLLGAVRDAERVPMKLTVDQDGARTNRILAYNGTLRYPRLERIAGQQDLLTALLLPR